MKIEIKHRFSGAVIFTHDAEENSIKITVESAIKIHANLLGANLIGANLVEANLRCANLIGANLAGANLRCANLAGANLVEANLAGANLAGANLAGANLRCANLIGANLVEANLIGANLDGAYLHGANLIEANLIGATYGVGVEIGINPIFVNGLKWPVYIFKSHIKIGCQIHRKTDWLAFDDSKISEMSPDALEFWTKWKKHILWMAFENVD